jgi:hypothetical protein
MKTFGQLTSKAKNALSQNSSGSSRKPPGDHALTINSSCSSQTPPEIPRNIIAFRTITTLLRFIQQDKLLEVTDPNTKTSDDDLRRLSILNALATVAITHQEIVAITSSNTKSSGLEIIASTTESEPPPQPSGIWGKFPWPSFLLTYNSEHSTQDGNPGYPILKAVVRPGDLKDDSNAELLQYLDKQYKSGPM